MNPFIETAAEAIQAGERARKETLRTWEQTNERTREMYRVEARDALASLAQHRDDIARELALASGDGWVFDLPPEYQEQDAVAAPLVRKHRDLADVVLAYLTGDEP